MRLRNTLRILMAGASLAIAEPGFDLAYDVAALPLPYHRSHIVEVGARFGDWRVFVAPEWIHREYGNLNLLGTESDRRTSQEEGFGVWTGFDLRPPTLLRSVFRLDTEPEDAPSPLRVGLYLRARSYEARRSGNYFRYQNPDDPWNRGLLIEFQNRRTEAIATLASGCVVAYAFEPYPSGTRRDRVVLEPYVRIGYGREWVTTTVHEGDRPLGTTRETLWNRDLRMGLFLGFKY